MPFAVLLAIGASGTGCGFGDGGADYFWPIHDAGDGGVDPGITDWGYTWDTTDPGPLADQGQDPMPMDPGSLPDQDTPEEVEDTLEEVITNPCPRVPGPADYVRKVVISLPFQASGQKSNRYEVLDLSTDGTLTRPGVAFEMGRLSMGELVFTPDGKVGIAPQDEDGTLGVFRVADGGQVEVVHAGFDGGFYPADVVMGPQGLRAFVLDTNWRNNGGGVYSVLIGCDGSLTSEGLVAPAKLPRALLFLPDDSGRVVVAADDLMDSTPGNDTHLLDWSLQPDLLSGVSAFGDDEAMVTAAAVTPNGRHFLLGDGSFFSGLPNRVAVVEQSGGQLVARQVISPVDDPVAVVASPFENAALVVSGYSNAVYVLSYDPAHDTAPFAWVGEPQYVAASPQLPGGAVLVERGGLTGRVLVPEVGGVHQFEFGPGGDVTDLGRLDLGDGSENIAGGIGVQP